MTFIIEKYFELILGIVLGIIFAGCYKSGKENIIRKIDNSQKQTFSSVEYINYNKLAEHVLDNTTISFKADNLDEKELETNLYYRTVEAGNTIMQSNMNSISEVGEI